MLLIILSAMFPLTRADANSMTAALPTHRHRHPLFMIGSTSCLNIAMLLMGIDIMFARSHHATDGRRHATFRTWSPLSMIGSTPCLNIAMLLMSIDIMSARPYHATDGRRHATFRALSPSVHGRF